MKTKTPRKPIAANSKTGIRFHDSGRLKASSRRASSQPRKAENRIQAELIQGALVTATGTADQTIAECGIVCDLMLDDDGSVSIKRPHQKMDFVFCLGNDDATDCKFTFTTPGELYSNLERILREIGDKACKTADALRALPRNEWTFGVFVIRDAADDTILYVTLHPMREEYEAERFGKRVTSKFEQYDFDECQRLLKAHRDPFAKKLIKPTA